MNEKKNLGSFHVAVIFGIVVAAGVLLFFQIHNYKENQREDSKAEETKAVDTEEVKTKDTEDTKATYAGEEEAATESPVKAGEASEDGIMQRLQNVDWENVPPRRLEDTDYQIGEILLLAEIPEADIIMYGYNDEEFQWEGVAVVMGGRPYYFDWYYTSPRLVMPQIYWNQENRQLQVSLHNFTGTSLAAEELHVLRQTEEGDLEDFFFAYDDYVSLLRERLAFSYEEETGQFSLYDKQESRELYKLDLSWLSEDAGLAEEAEPGEPLVENFAAGDISRFLLGDEIRMRVTPGYVVNCWATPQYDEMSELEVEICLEESEGRIRFLLGDIKTVN